MLEMPRFFGFRISGTDDNWSLSNIKAAVKETEKDIMRAEDHIRRLGNMYHRFHNNSKIGLNIVTAIEIEKSQLERSRELLSYYREELRQKLGK